MLCIGKTQISTETGSWEIGKGANFVSTFLKEGGGFYQILEHGAGCQKGNNLLFIKFTINSNLKKEKQKSKDRNKLESFNFKFL